MRILVACIKKIKIKYPLTGFATFEVDYILSKKC